MIDFQWKSDVEKKLKVDKKKSVTLEYECNNLTKNFEKRFLNSFDVQTLVLTLSARWNQL